MLERTGNDLGNSGVNRVHFGSKIGIHKMAFKYHSIICVFRIYRVGQNRVYTPYMTVYLVISLPKYSINTVYIYIYIYMVLAGQPYVLNAYIAVWNVSNDRMTHP